jgi:hypothetical protein
MKLHIAGSTDPQNRDCSGSVGDSRTRPVPAAMTSHDVVILGMPPSAVIAVITVPVDVGDGRLDSRVAYHDPVPVLLEAACGCLQGDLDALLDKLSWHGTVEVQPLAHGARGGQ